MIKKDSNPKRIKKIITLGFVSLIMMFALIGCVDDSNVKDEGDTQIDEEVALDDEEIHEESADEIIDSFVRGEVEGVEYREEESGNRDKIIDYFRKDDPDTALMNTVYIDSYAKDIVMEGKNGEVNLLDVIKEEDGAFIEFMGPWCDACVQILDELNNIQEGTGKKILALGINVESQQELENFKEEMGSQQDYYFVDDFEALDNYGIQFVPTIFYINGDGVIELVINGDTPAEDILEMIDIK